MVGRDARSGGQDAHEIKRVAGAQAHDFALPLLSSSPPERFHRTVQCVLLAQETRNEAPATGQPPCLPAPKCPHDVAPWQSEALSCV